MGMGFAPTWLRQVSSLPHKTTLTTDLTAVGPTYLGLTIHCGGSLDLSNSNSGPLAGQVGINSAVHSFTTTGS